MRILNTKYALYYTYQSRPVMILNDERSASLQIFTYESSNELHCFFNVARLKKLYPILILNDSIKKITYPLRTFESNQKDIRFAFGIVSVYYYIENSQRYKYK